MTLGRGTHWKGPLLGAENSGDGLFEDYPADVMSQQDTWIWQTSFLDHHGTTAAAATTFGAYWVNEFVVAGTATIAQDTASPILSLTHGVAAQGPFVRWAGTAGGVGGAGARGNTITSLIGPSSFFCEATACFQANGTRDDAFLGFCTNAAATPLSVGPPSTVNVAGVPNGIGFHWNNAGATGIPTLVCWSNGVSQTLTGAPTNLVANVNGVQQYWGVRVDTNAAGTNSASWYVNRRRVFRHLLTTAFTARMTFGLQLVARGAGGQFNISRVALGRRADVPASFPLPPA